MSNNQPHVKQTIKNENLPVHGNPETASSRPTWSLNLLATILNFNCSRLIEFWNTVSQKPYFKKYGILLPFSVLLLILWIIVYNLFGISNEDKNVNELVSLKSCIEDVTITFENTKDVDTIKKCSAIDEPIKAKSKIRFVMGASEFFDCIVQGTPSCEKHLKKEKEMHTNDYKLKDIYFNYIIRDKPKFYIYEGRSLNCSFDEYSLTENHESTIIIGIPQCNNLDRVKKFNKNKFDEFLKEFLNCFETSGLLTENYKIEFHESCINNMFSKKTLKSYDDKISFTDDHKIMNVDYYFQSDTTIEPL